MWWLAHAVQQLLQHDGIVELLVPGSEDQRNPLAFSREVVELGEGIRRRGFDQFLQVFLAELLPLSGTRMEPLSQLIRGRKVAQPRIELR